MKSYELVAQTIRGRNTGRTPIYGWIAWNLDWAANDRFPVYTAFEDHYEFDLAHLFGGPACFDEQKLAELRKSGVEITPEVLLEIPLRPADLLADYQAVREQLDFYRQQRGRFCYIQTNGIFECLNGPFGIENHLLYLALYPEELKAVYRRQAEWNSRFIENMIELGVDMIHISDDWGAQNSLLFSRAMLAELIVPYHQMMSVPVKKAGKFLSLHSDGNINQGLDQILSIGYDVVHPWQETAGMSYAAYLEKYCDKFAIFGGLCIQSTLGFGDYQRLEREIRRVFSLLKGRRWIFCTTHFVQDHCSFAELEFAYDLAAKLARS